MQTEAAAETGTPADKAEPQPRPGGPPCPRRGAGGSGGAVRPAAWVAVCGGRHVRSLGELQPPRRPGPPTPRSCLTCVFQGQQARELGRGRGEQAGTGVRPQRGLARPDACARRGATSRDLGRPCPGRRPTEPASVPPRPPRPLLPLGPSPAPQGSLWGRHWPSRHGGRAEGPGQAALPCCRPRKGRRTRKITRGSFSATGKLPLA